MNAISGDNDYEHNYYEFGKKYEGRGYGGGFASWLQNPDRKPYGSWGNGSAMRVSPIGWACDTLEETLEEAQWSAEVTHNHPEGIKGAQSVAGAIYLARTGRSKAEIKTFVETTFGYDLNRTIDQIRPNYKFEVSCQKSVPEAIIAFLESKDFESAIRLGISLGGDSDTIACITGGIAEAFYGEIPAGIQEQVKKLLPWELLDVVISFSNIEF